VNDPQLAFALLLAAAHTGTFGLGCAVYAWMHRHGIAAEHRVAGGAAPDLRLLRHARREVWTGQPVFGLLCYFLVYPAWVRFGGTFEMPSSPTTWIVHPLVFVLVNDTIFYFSHRLLHVGWFWKNVHGRHHRFRYTRGVAAEYAHPLEDLLNFVAFVAGPILMGSPLPVVLAWVVVRMFETVDAHSGFVLTPWASRHAFHHMHAVRGCYGSFAGLWDRVLGTEREWKSVRTTWYRPRAS